MATISERESREVEAANASGTTPVVFIHGLWLLPSSWANWADFFKQAGYAPLTPDWPDDPETVEEARANPDVLAKKTLKQVADHTADVIGELEKKPAVMGHSTGGLFAQMGVRLLVAGEGPGARHSSKGPTSQSHPSRDPRRPDGRDLVDHLVEGGQNEKVAPAAELRTRTRMKP